MSELVIPIENGYTERIRSEVSLPYNLGSHIGIDAPFVHALLQIAGFRHLRIESNATGEISKDIPAVVGVSNNGEAIAGKVISTFVPTAEHDLIAGRAFRKQARWGDLIVKLNTTEIQNRVLKKNKSVRDSSAWAKEINKGLRKSVAEAGVNYLLWGFDTAEKILALFLYTDDVLFACGSGSLQMLLGQAKPHYPEAADLAMRFALTGISMGILDSMIYGLEKPGTGRRISLFYGMELDRAVVLKIVSSLKPIAKKI